MQKVNGPVAGRAKYTINEVDVNEFKPCAKKTPLHLFMSGQGEQQDQDSSLTGCPYHMCCKSDSSLCGLFASDSCPYLARPARFEHGEDGL